MRTRSILNNECPECGNLLNRSLFDQITSCIRCSWHVSNAQFDSMVEEIYKKRRRKSRSDDDNLSALNNLGHEKVEEDFSDSPHLDY